MPGYFDIRNLFGDDQDTGFFGGYRARNLSTDADNGSSSSAAIPIVDNTVATATNGRGLASDALTYPDGKQVIDPRGNPYPRPPGMDVPTNIAVGQQIAPLGDLVPQLEAPINDRDAHMIGLFAAGRPMDYQRPNGYFAAKLYGDVHREYRGVANYNMGVVAAAAGYSRDEALYGAGTYNRVAGQRHPNDTRYGIPQDAVDDIGQGYDDYTNGRWKQKSPN